MSNYISFPETSPKIDNMKRSALSRENSPCLNIEAGSPPLLEKKQKLETEVVEGGDVVKKGRYTSRHFKMFPIMKYSDNDTNNDDDDDDNDDDDDDRVLEKYIEHPVDPYASDGDYDSDTWNKYCDQINKSEGFDVDLEVFPRGCDMAPFHPIPYFKEFPKLVKDLEALADSALRWFNTEHSTKYELVEIEKVVQQYWHYFLTFKAKDHEQADADAAHKTFQARVFDGLKGPDVKLCRIKN